MNTMEKWMQTALEKFTDKTAVIVDKNKFSFEQLDSLAKSVEQEFERLSFSSGSTIVCAIPNSIELVVLLIAALRKDVAVFLVPHDAVPAEAEKIVSTEVFPAVFLPKNIDEAVRNIYSNHAVNLCTLSYDNNKIVFDNQKKNATVKLDSDSTGYSLRMLSSGSTGTRKSMYRTLESLEHLAISIRDCYFLKSDDVFMSVAPACHIMGAGGIFSALYLGCTLVLVTKFSPPDILFSVARNGVTFLPASPFMYDVLCSFATTETKIPTLQKAISSGAPLPEKVYNKFKETFNVPLHELYGSTEATVAAAKTDNGSYIKNMVGKPATGVTIIIVDENFNELPAGEVGSVATKGPAVVKEYINNPEATAEAFKNGYVLVGDRGYKDSEGNIYIVGRTSLTINVGGKKVDIVEVEDVLAECPGVEEALVYAKKIDSTDVVCAGVVAKDVTAEQIRLFCKEKISAYKIPKEIKFIESIPRTKVGKVDRSEALKQLL